MSALGPLVVIEAIGLRPVVVPRLGRPAILVETHKLLLLDDDLSAEALNSIADHLVEEAVARAVDA